MTTIHIMFFPVLESSNKSRLQNLLFWSLFKGGCLFFPVLESPNYKICANKFILVMLKLQTVTIFLETLLHLFGI
ncbi:hypothetical protein L6452_36599 [Arctium lappa]|uniref:Uncharacterized protein n=1 Tax=Arctium lappa TaxID=4217 RepID=A0ACB8YA96_ARCLA|nr:hypothetical protein L6452_36599 [Arctium lappa]